MPRLPCRFRYFFTVSPDACSNPVLYWLGSYADSRFALEAAAGPFRLDLGDVVYAPNIMTDGQGRHLLWAWLQVGGGAELRGWCCAVQCWVVLVLVQCTALHCTAVLMQGGLLQTHTSPPAAADTAPPCSLTAGAAHRRRVRLRRLHDLPPRAHPGRRPAAPGAGA
jgi:hypothetical protein